jgi:hypothetical protein
MAAAGAAGGAECDKGLTSCDRLSAKIGFAVMALSAIVLP